MSKKKMVEGEDRGGDGESDMGTTRFALNESNKAINHRFFAIYGLIFCISYDFRIFFEKNLRESQFSNILRRFLNNCDF